MFPQETFARAKTWVKELQRQASPSIVIALAGNKADLANKRMVEYEVRWPPSPLARSLYAWALFFPNLPSLKTSSEDIHHLNPQFCTKLNTAALCP